MCVCVCVCACVCVCVCARARARARARVCECVTGIQTGRAKTIRHRQALRHTEPDRYTFQKKSKDDCHKSASLTRTGEYDLNPDTLRQRLEARGSSPRTSDIGTAVIDDHSTVTASHCLQGIAGTSSWE